MKQILSTVSCIALMLVVSLQASAQKSASYGKKFKTENAYSVDELGTKISDGNKLEHIVVTGEITQVCQTAGCWMKLRNEGGKDIFVKFGDHAFVIPKDMAGRRAYVKGTVLQKTVSVEELRHYAEDEGNSEEEIDQITESRTEIQINATGVVIE